MTRTENHQQESESASSSSSTAGSTCEEWADRKIPPRKNFSLFFCWSVDFFVWLQVLLSFSGLYLPRSDKTHSNFWKEQWLIPLEGTKRLICRCCIHGKKETRRENVYGIERWLLHWWWTRIFNLLQVGYLVQLLLVFPLSYSYVHSFQNQVQNTTLHFTDDFTHFHPASKKQKR